MKIYLAGSVPKGDTEVKGFTNWRLEYDQVLKGALKDVEVIDPYSADSDKSDFLLVVGSDSSHIKSADLIIVNTQEKMGVGTAMELDIAKYLKKVVVTILSKDSHHRRSNVIFHGKLIRDWIHPFIFAFSDHVLESINDIESLEITKKPKDITVVDEAIVHFNKKRLNRTEFE